MSDLRPVVSTQLGYGDRITPDGVIQQFAILELHTEDGKTDYELSPDALATLSEQVTNVQTALESLRRREARRESRSRSGWRHGSRD